MTRPLLLSPIALRGVYGWWLDKRQKSLTPQDAAAAVERVAGIV